MSLIINTNISSLIAQQNLSAVTMKLQSNYAHLSSGLRITSAADDAAGLGISERLRAKIAAWAVAGRNTQDGISLAQTGEGALNNVNSMLSRMRELATEAANGTLSPTDRTTAATLGINGLNVTTAANASTAITALSTAIDTVNTARGVFGADMNRLQDAFSNTQIQDQNLSSAESRIRDVDVAAETAALTRNTILQQAAVSVLSQANVQPQLALKLLG